MNEIQMKLEQIVTSAISSFNNNEFYIVNRDLSERCICAKFAQYLDNEVKQSGLVGYDTDVEYNRGYKGNEYAMKRLDDGKLIVTDLIVHKRGFNANYGFDNLICIEMKKSKNELGLEKDLERLYKMTTIDYGFCYKVGYMIIANQKQGILEIYRSFYNESC